VDDGRCVAIGSLEDQFYGVRVEALSGDLPLKPGEWPVLGRLQETFAVRVHDDWRSAALVRA